MRHKIDSSIVSKEVVTEVCSKLQSLFCSRYLANYYLKCFVKLDPNIQTYVIEEILRSQSDTIVKAMEDRYSISIPQLGKFEYRDGHELVLNHTYSRLKEMGYNTINDVPPSEKHAIIAKLNEENAIILKEKFMSEYHGKGNHVLDGFK